MNYLNTILAVLTLSLFSCQAQESKAITKLDAKTFNSKITSKTKIQLIDVRTPQEYGENHIGTAENINFYDTNFEQKLAKLDKSKPIYVYCKAGGRSAKAAEKLAQMGFTEIYDLDGGITSWEKVISATK